jgi:hypothetical protein
MDGSVVTGSAYYFKRGAKLHIDLDGISRIEFASSITEKLDEIERELIAAKRLKKSR